MLFSVMGRGIVHVKAGGVAREHLLEKRVMLASWDACLNNTVCSCILRGILLAQCTFASENVVNRYLLVTSDLFLK
jgi:hypothetical protein